MQQGIQEQLSLSQCLSYVKTFNVGTIQVIAIRNSFRKCQAHGKSLTLKEATSLMQHENHSLLNL